MMENNRYRKGAIVWMGVIHAGSFLAPFFFSWSAVEVFVLSLVATCLSVTLAYHRLLAHRSFAVPRWLEYVLVTFASFSLQGPAVLWVGLHRYHHLHSDTDRDPHTPRKGFWHSHLGHMLLNRESELSRADLLRHAPDLAKQPFYIWIDRIGPLLALASFFVLYHFGGWSWVIWGGFLRIAVSYHFTGFVNSASHVWGYRNYETDDDSRNVWWVGILAMGEGWHNNHHAHPTCAAHGRKWWEFDLTYICIRSLEVVGLAKQVKKPELFEN